MSRIGSPQISHATGIHSTAYAALERLSRQTPDLDDLDDVPETSPRTECRLLLIQGWGGNDPIIVERNRKNIEDQQYWRDEIDCKLAIIKKLALNAGLPQLHKATDSLDLVLLGLGMPHDDVGKSRFEVANGVYWEIEQSYWESIRRRTQLSFENPQPAPPTHTTLEQEDSVLVPRSVNLSLSPNKRVVQKSRVQNDRVNTGRVQKKTPKGNNWRGKKRTTKASRHQEPEQQDSPSASAARGELAMEELARKGELGLPGPSKPISGKRMTSPTTLDEGKAAGSRSSDKHAKPKKTADKLRRVGNCSEGGRKSARIEKKQQTKTREYRLRNRIITTAVTL
ncbi:hypothetical protein V8C35DRAFT_300840 [Trichoderma chlorosporum]